MSLSIIAWNLMTLEEATDKAIDQSTAAIIKRATESDLWQDLEMETYNKIARTIEQATYLATYYITNIAIHEEIK